MHVSGRPTAAFDPEGLVFAAGINSEYLNLYDLRSFDKGPFGTFKPSMSEFTGTEWTSLKFSPDGRTILICTNGSYLRLVNSFTGAHLHSFNVSSSCLRFISRTVSLPYEVSNCYSIFTIGRYPLKFLNGFVLID